MAVKNLQYLIEKSLEHKKKEESAQKEKITLRQYIDNPSGKGSAYLAKRATIKQGLNMTFIKLLREYKRAFTATPYIYDTGDILYHVTVPSEFYKTNKIC